MELTQHVLPLPPLRDLHHERSAGRGTIGPYKRLRPTLATFYVPRNAGDRIGYDLCTNLGDNAKGNQNETDRSEESSRHVRRPFRQTGQATPTLPPLAHVMRRCLILSIGSCPARAFEILSAAIHLLKGVTGTRVERRRGGVGFDLFCFGVSQRTRATDLFASFTVP